MYDMKDDELRNSKYQNGEHVQCEGRVISLSGTVLVTKSGYEVFYQKGMYSFRPSANEITKKAKYLSRI